MHTPIAGPRYSDSFASSVTGRGPSAARTAAFRRWPGNATRTSCQLANFANAERDSSAMHAVVTLPALHAAQVWSDLAAYLNGLPNRSPLSLGSGDDVALGRGIFHEQCAGCHGADAGGDDDGFAPSLRHQHYGYLHAQMRKLAQGYRHNMDEDLMRFLASFTDHDMSATADYLSRLTGAGKDRRTMGNDGVVVD
jgi:cytochrome c553